MRPLFATCTAGAVCALLLAISFAPARAADDEKSFDQKLLGGLLEGIGLQRERPPIEYNQRPPLVIPPTKTLPPPETGDVAAANPAWPKDPDVKRRREAAKRERERDVEAERMREQNPLMPSEIAVGERGAPQSARRDDGYQPSPTGFSEKMMPDQLGYTGGLIKRMFGGGDGDKPVRFTGEPTRTDLTSPPTGYQTPSPEQPYGPGKAGPAKPTNDYETRAEPAR